MLFEPRDHLDGAQNKTRKVEQMRPHIIQYPAAGTAKFVAKTNQVFWMHGIPDFPMCTKVVGRAHIPLPHSAPQLLYTVEVAVGEGHLMNHLASLG